AQHRQIEHAAGLAIEAGPRPARAPAKLGRPFRHRAGEFVSARNRLVDGVLAKHFLANFETLFEQFSLAHDQPFIFLMISTHPQSSPEPNASTQSDFLELPAAILVRGATYCRLQILRLDRLTDNLNT